MEKYCRSGQATDDSRAHAQWITKATNTHSEYVIHVTFPLQQVASVLRYAYIACHQIQLRCRSEDGHRSCPRDLLSIFILIYIKENG